MFIRVILTLVLIEGALRAQDQPATMEKVLERLEVIEKQNTELTNEVRALRQEIGSLRSSPTAVTASGQPPIEERVAVAESRIEEQSQSKVESAQKTPLILTGMVLFNSFLNGGAVNAESPVYSDLLSGASSAGATLSQTLIGLRFNGPSLPGGGKVTGELSLDFFSGGYSADWLRIRRGTVSMEWQNRTITAGQDKPLIAPRQPDSLAEVGVPPLAGSGNLWLWLPQIRYEERMHFGATNGLTGQVAVLQTQESYAEVPDEYEGSLEANRPAIEGRVSFWHKWDDKRRFELAPGFHASSTHVAGTSVPSRLASLDWLLVPSSKLEFSGAFFRGRNFADVGGLPTAFTVQDELRVIPVHGEGGWAQISSPLTSRLTMNVFGGVQQNRDRDLIVGDLSRNFTYASNLMYRVSPNLMLSLEALQERSRLLQSGNLIRNHYDLAVAYLF